MASEEQWREWMERYAKENNENSVAVVKEEPEKVDTEWTMVQQPEVKTVSNELECLGNILLDDSSGITWDLYRLDQRDKLELKIRMALCPESVKIDETTGKVRDTLRP